MPPLAAARARRQARQRRRATRPRLPPRSRDPDRVTTVPEWEAVGVVAAVVTARHPVAHRARPPERWRGSRCECRGPRYAIVGSLACERTLMKASTTVG